ncbi:MAG TPA: agglutinin biogenesis protein MshP [Duganella sp.]|nr:agglutinin biogenesis protein MshP [Duganella sp.]
MKKTIRRKPAGVALVTAIFLLVVLAGLGVAIISLTTSQQASAVQDEQGARAYEAARAGIEWALFRVRTSNASPQASALACPTTFPLPRNTSLSAFTVTITCSGVQPGYGDNSAQDPTAGHFRIVATACNGAAGAPCPSAAPGPDYVQRVIEAQL